VQSKHFAGEDAGDAANNQHLIKSLQAHSDRRAYFVSVLVFIRHADDPQPLIAQGTWWGEILHTPRGANGFGYDPYFFDPTLNKTAAEMSLTEKNHISHRGQALVELIAQFRQARLC
jgi:XTP/dITP diphosphohydrolase